MAETKKFRSASGTDVRLALLSGHVTIVGNEWVDLQEVFWRDAYANGCVSNDMEVFKNIDQLQEAGVIDKLQALTELKGKVRAAIDKCLADGDPENFTANKGPKAAYLNAEVGAVVPANVREEMWNEYVLNGATAPGASEGEELSNDVT
jgi:hypothetical protein